MIDKTNILNTLQRLDTEYNTAITDPDLPIFYSKLAVLEFCGWIEKCYDTILYEYLDAHILDAHCKNIIKKFVNNNYGFAYEKNTFHIFSIVLGANNWENVLDKLSDADKTNLESVLTNYSRIRNIAAHTNIKGTTETFQSPSTVISDFNLMLPILSLLETEIQNL